MDDFTLEFRDGKRSVAPHVYEMLRNVETHVLTYEEAIHAANSNAIASHANRKVDEMIAKHFRDNS